MRRDEGGSAIRILVVDRGGDLAARIRHHAATIGTVVRGCTDTVRAETLLAAGPWDVVVAGPSLMHAGGLRRLAALHDHHPWVAVVLAVAERPRAELADIVGVGADDLVPLHGDDATLAGALARAGRIARGRIGAPDRAAAGRRGRIVTVASASGGSGKTFLATNAAEFLTRTTDRPVVLVDLDLQFGEVSTALRLRPEVTLTDALTAEADGYDLDEILDDFLLRHPDGFKVLAAPRLPAEADSVTPGDVIRVLDALRARGAWVVVDTHEGLSDLSAAALEVTDHAFAVATPDRPSIVNLGRYLGALDRLGVARSTVSIIMNKVEAGAGLDRAELSALLGRRIEAMIPYTRAVPRSINRGVPLVVAEPKSPVTAMLAAALAAAFPSRRRRPVLAPRPAAVVLPAPAEPEAVRPEPPAGIPAHPTAPVDIDLTAPLDIDLTGPAPVPWRGRPVPAEPFDTPCRDRAPPASRGHADRDHPEPAGGGGAPQRCRPARRGAYAPSGPPH